MSGYCEHALASLMTERRKRRPMGSKEIASLYLR